MKKLLALVLALVMTLGLATVGASAALKDFSDADSISADYEEAFAVMNAVGVFVGSDGKLNPAGNLTRAQAAKIIAYLNLGETAAEALSKDVTAFSDVPAGHWAAGYISYCYNSGIVGGKGNNKYDPDANVTALEFAKMLLVTLGYEAKREGLVGKEYALNTMRLAAINSLFDKNDDVAVNSPATREEAALYAFNALKAECVNYTSSTVSVTGADGSTINVSGGSGAHYTGNVAYNMAITDESTTVTAASSFLQLGEKLYKGDLALRANAATAGNYGEPGARRWTYKGKDIINIARDPVATFNGYTSAADVAKALNGYYLRDVGNTTDYAINNTTTYTNGGTGFNTAGIVLTNGAGAAALAVAGVANETIAKAISDETANGKTVKVFANSTTKRVDSINEIVYGYGEITNIIKGNDRTTYNINNGAAHAGGMIDYVDETADDTIVFAKGYTPAKGDIVTWADGVNAIEVYPTTKITGTQTSTVLDTSHTLTGGGAHNMRTITVGGTTYTIAEGVTAGTTDTVVTAYASNSSNEANYYLDQFGYVVYSNATASTQYAYILNMVGNYTASLSGAPVSVQARVLLPDGTIADYDVALTKISATTTPAAGSAVTTVTARKLNGNGSALAPGDYVIKGGNVRVYDVTTKTNNQGGYLSTVLGDYQYEAVAYTLSGTTMTITEKVNYAFPTAGTLAASTEYVANVAALAKGTLSYAAATDPTNTNANAFVADSKTVFTIYDTDAKKATVYTGVNGVPASISGTANIVAVLKTGTASGTANGVAKQVFATVGAALASDKVDYALVDYRTETTTGTSTKIYNYNAMTKDGTTISLSTKTQLTEFTLVSYNADNEIVTTLNDVSTNTPVSTAPAYQAYGYDGTATATETTLSADGAAFDLSTANIYYCESNLGSIDTNTSSTIFFVLKTNSDGAVTTQVETVYVIAAVLP